MLKLYSNFDDRVRPLVYAVKYWTKRRHISDPPSGSLSSYSHVIMVIHYLQHIHILPSLQDLIHHENVDHTKHVPKPHYYNAYDCRFVGDLELARSIFYADHAKNETLTV
ncbi:polyA RNA polymerase, partial [Acrasis kona]